MITNEQSRRTGSGRFIYAALPTIGNIIFIAVLIVLAFSSGSGLLGDGDTGYHIRTGQVILQGLTIPDHDIFSYHSPPLSWTAHEWLSEVIMAGIYQVGGLTGVVVFFALLLAFTHWGLYHVLRKNSANIILCVLITLLATATSSTHWLARPHVFSLMLTLTWCHLLGRFQYQHQRVLFYLPPIMMFWVNLHGGFVIGLIVLSIHLTGNLLYSFTQPPIRARLHIQKTKALLLCLIIATMACLINPHGYKILLFPFQTTSDRFLMDHVAEFLSPNFHEVLPFKYMLLTMVAILAISRQPVNLIEAGLLVLLSYMALYSVRHVSLFAIIAAPILLRLCEGVMTRFPSHVLGFFQDRNRRFTALEAKLGGYLWPCVTILSIIGLSLNGRLHYAFNDTAFPVAAVDFLKRANLPGKMFNNDEFGDYLIFAAWPEYRVFMDGRSDMYGKEYGGAYLRVANAQPGWKDVLKDYDINWVIFDTASSLTATLSEQTDWLPIYSDAVATIFIKNDNAPQSNQTTYQKVPLATKSATQNLN